MYYADKIPLTSIIIITINAVIRLINLIVKSTFGFNRLFLYLTILGIINVRSPKIIDITKTHFQNTGIGCNKCGTNINAMPV